MTSQEYDRGHVAGGIDERLNEYGRHFTKINGSIDRFTDEMRQVRMAVQGLTDAADADRATAITLAAALEKAETARRHAAEKSWTPFTKAFAIIAALGVLVTVFLALRGI
jgi:phage-related minor tail protein